MLPVAHHFLMENRARQNRQLILYRKQLTDASNPFQLPERRFIELFRLSRAGAQYLIEFLRPHLDAGVLRTRISIEIRVLVALRYYATGAYQRTLGEDFHLGLSQTSAQRCIHRVTSTICNNMADLYIKFPQSVRERNRCRAEFMDRFHFPGVIGAVDGTHVAILKPHEKHNFINRKGYHSLNVQIVCRCNLKILNLNANYGGSTHDAFIWRNSQVQTYMRNVQQGGERNCWLFGDSGHPLQPHLLTPVANVVPNTPAANYNAAHAAARNTVERTIGLLKTRFRCILKERTSRYNPRFVADLVTACAVLHNLCIDRDIPLYDNEPVNDDNVPGVHLQENEDGDQRHFNEGRLVRQNVINRYFV